MKNTFIMVAIALVAGCLLGIVHDVTKEPIAAQELKATVDAYRKAFPGAASFSESVFAEYQNADLSECPYEGVEVLDCLSALDSEGAGLGYVYKVVSHGGYGGDIVLFAGILNDGTLNSVSITKISETAGLGMNASKVLVPQFSGKNVTAFEVVKNKASSIAEIDAISGATRTSNAVTDAVNLALWYFNNITGGANNEQ